MPAAIQLVPAGNSSAPPRVAASGTALRPPATRPGPLAARWGADGQLPPRKIFLVGYRACGKTLVGKGLAARLDWRFLDMDREISRRAAMSIKEMVSRHGWEYFRDRERQLLQELSRQPAPPPGLVVATGGGAVMQRDLWREIKTACPVIWLDADPATIADRISGDASSGEQRPPLTDQGLLGEISEVLRQREELYRQAAHRHIDTTTLAPAAIIDEIIAWLSRCDHGPNRATA